MRRTTVAAGSLLCGLAVLEAAATSTPLLAAGLTGLLGLTVIAAGIVAARQRQAALDRVQQKRAAADQRLDELRHRAAVLHHAVPDPSVLEGLLPVRAAALAGAPRPDANARDQQWRDAAPVYRAAISGGPLPADESHRMTLQGLTWWMPIVRPGDQARVERYVEHQDFPYRALAQTAGLAGGGAMLDIGANIGRMCIPRVLLGHVRVAYCAEPDPLNFRCLVRNSVDNHLAGLVIPDQLAISDHNGSVRLQRAKTAGGHRVLSDTAANAGETVTVPSMTLEAWVDRLGLDLRDLTFVKVDAQGSEVDVLRGAGRVLACRHVAWQIEVEPVMLERRGFSVDDLFGLLGPHFTHFIDLNRHVTGPRTRPMAEAPEALGYVKTEGRTDAVFFNLATS